VNKTNWKRIDQALRAQLEALLQEPTAAYYSDYGNAAGWWLLTFVAAAGGVGFGLWYVFTSELASRLTVVPERAVLDPVFIGLVVAVLVCVWVVVRALRHRGRHGFAALDAAIVVVRGPKLGVIRYDEVAGVTQMRAGSRGRKFTVLKLKLKDGSTESLSVSGNWANEVLARLGLR